MTQYTKVIDGHGHCFEFALLLVSWLFGGWVDWLVGWLTAKRTNRWMTGAFLSE